MNRKELEAHLREGRAKLRHKRQSDRDKLRAENDTRVREFHAEVARLRTLALKFLDEQTDENAAALRAALERKP
jgi:hypothetical protein